MPVLRQGYPTVAAKAQVQAKVGPWGGHPVDNFHVTAQTSQTTKYSPNTCLLDKAFGAHSNLTKLHNTEAQYPAHTKHKRGRGFKLARVRVETFLAVPFHPEKLNMLPWLGGRSWQAQELWLLQAHQCGTTCIAPLGQVQIENQSWWARNPCPKRPHSGSGNHLSVERQLPPQGNVVLLHVNSMPPLADSSQRSTPKWIFVGSRRWKLSHRLTCALRPVACQRLVVLRAMAVHAVHSSAGAT